MSETPNKQLFLIFYLIFLPVADCLLTHPSRTAANRFLCTANTEQQRSQRLCKRSCCRSERINSALSRTVQACDSAAHCANMASAATRERAELSASDRSGNSTSTLEYSHEPWESLQCKVHALASQMFPNSRNANIEIQRMRGGSSNRVVGVSVRTPSPRGIVSAI